MSDMSFPTPFSPASYSSSSLPPSPQGCRKRLRIRQRKPQRTAGVAQVIDQVSEARARNVRLLERGQHALRPHVAAGQGMQGDGAIQHAHRWIVQVGGQPFR